MHYLESILRVLVIGLILGAGLPAVFAVGLVAQSRGSGEGSVRQPNTALKLLSLVVFAVVALVILAAILWITRATIDHHFDIDPFPFLPKK